MTDDGTMLADPQGLSDPTGPYGTRLLSGWFTTGGPAGLEEHLRRYGMPPVPRATGRRNARPLVRAVEDGRVSKELNRAVKLRATEPFRRLGVDESVLGQTGVA